MTIISIGIMAHNEEDQITAMIGDLVAQTIFQKPQIKFKVHIVANGCVDNTSETAKAALEHFFGNSSTVVGVVNDLSQPGKANAWNEFIHKLCDNGSEFVVLLDADIRLPQNNAIELALDCLANNPAANVSVDEAIKDVAIKPDKGLADLILLGFSGTAHNTQKAIAGSFYCARYRVVKEIWMPTGIIGEDGYLRAMIMTSGFTQAENRERIKFAEGAWHVFETRRDVRDIFHHQVRLAIGTGLNGLLFSNLREVVARGQDVGTYIRERNGEDKSWLNSLVTKEMARGRYFVMGSAFLARRFRFFKNLTLKNKLRKFPIYVLGASIDFIVYLRANSLMRKGASAGFW